MAVSIAFAQPVGGATKTYAAPLPVAPTITVPPETATERPSWSCPVASEAVSLAVSVASVQPAAGLTNTYA